jgi:hypothetical protein
MGKGGGQPTTTRQEITQTNLPSYVRPYFERLLQRTEAESQRDYEPFPGQRIADVSPDLLASEQRVRDIANRGLPGIYDSRRAIDTGLGLIGRGVGGFDTAQRLVGEGSEIARGTLGQYGRAEDLLDRTLGTIDETKGMVRDARGDISDARGQLGKASTRTEQAFGFDPYQFADARQFTGEERDRYMSPYMEGVIDVQKRRAREDYLKSMPQQAATAIGAGAFGGSREGVQRAEAQSDYLDRLSDIEATGRQQAFDRASQLFEADRRAEMGLDQTRAAERRQAEQLGLGAAGQLAGQAGRLAGFGGQEFSQDLRRASALGGLGGQERGIAESFAGLGRGRLGVGQALGGFGGQMGQFGQGIAGLGTQFGQLGGQYANLSERARAGDVEAARMLEQIGKAGMARDQAGLDLALEDFRRQQAFPQERLGIFSSILRGIPVQPSTTTQVQQPFDPFGRAIGLGLTALGGSRYASGRR